MSIIEHMRLEAAGGVIAAFASIAGAVAALSVVDVPPFHRALAAASGSTGTGADQSAIVHAVSTPVMASVALCTLIGALAGHLFRRTTSSRRLQ